MLPTDLLVFCVSSHLTHTTHTEQAVLTPGTVNLQRNRMLWSPLTPKSASPSGCKVGEEVIVGWLVNCYVWKAYRGQGLVSWA